jgi:hypothetical protein
MRVCLLGFVVTSIHAIWSPLGFWPCLAGASCEFEVGSAETFSRPSEFDVVIHFGTLYHLPSPQPPALAPPKFREPETGRLPRAGDSGLRSSAGSQHLLFHAHAEQRSHQLLCVEHSGLEEKSRTDWILRRARSEKNRRVDAGRTHEPQ